VLCVCVSSCVRVSACVRARTRVRVRVCARGCVCVCVWNDPTHAPRAFLGFFFLFCGAKADPFNAAARKRRVCVQKASGAPDDMAAAARCMNEYLDMFPQAQVLRSTLLMSICIHCIMLCLYLDMFPQAQILKTTLFMDLYRTYTRPLTLENGHRCMNERLDWFLRTTTRGKSWQKCTWSNSRQEFSFLFL
jgi:hypothetical protein